MAGSSDNVADTKQPERRFAMIPESILWSDYDAQTVRVYGGLAYWANKHTAAGFIVQGTEADRLQMSIATYKRCLARLRADGHVVTTRRRDKTDFVLVTNAFGADVPVTGNPTETPHEIVASPTPETTAPPRQMEFYGERADVIPLDTVRANLPPTTTAPRPRGYNRSPEAERARRGNARGDRQLLSW